MAIAAAVALLATVFVYRPDRDVAFDFLDFSEFLPLLRRGDSFGDRLRELVSYYGDQGRFNLIMYVALALKWGVWGDSSPAWQWLRFITMWGVIALTYLLLRRLRLRPIACAAGASIFLFAPPSADGWIRLTMAEPVGVLLLLVACLIALAVVPRSRETYVGILFAGVCGLVVLVKEMLAPALVLPVALVAVGIGHHALQLPRSRVLMLAGAGLAAIVLSGIPVAVIALNASADAFTTEFGSQFRTLGDSVAEWTLGIIPFDPATSVPPSLAGIALLSLFALLGTGWTLRIRSDAEGSERSWKLLAIGLLFPLLGAMVYLPWPAYNRFYAIPYLIGGALLAAVALSAMLDSLPRLGYVAMGVWAAYLVFGGAGAAADSSRMAVRRSVNRSVLTRLSIRTSQIDTFYLATDQRPAAAWQGVGPTLERFGRALGLEMPYIVDLPCEEGRRRARAGRAAVIFYSSLCPGVRSPDPIVMHYRRWPVPAIHLAVDSIRVDIVAPVPPGRLAGAATR